MKTSIIGATGMIGSRLVCEAARRGHDVTAASRNPNIDVEASSIETISVDVSDVESLVPALADADAAILAVRPGPGREHTLATLTANVLDVAASTHTRVLVIGGAGPLRSPTSTELLVVDDPAYVPVAWRTSAAASTAQLATCEQHPDADWTYLSPPAIVEPGSRTGRYRRGTTTLLVEPDGTSYISAEDLAVAAIDEIEQPKPDRHFTVIRGTPTQPLDASAAPASQPTARAPCSGTRGSASYADPTARR